MDLSFSADQQTLYDSARSLLSASAPVEGVSDVTRRGAGFDEALFAQMASLGWTSLGLTEEESSLLDLGIVLTQLGAHATPSPLPVSMMAGLTLKRLGDEAAVAETLEQIGAGRIATLVVDPQTDVETDANGGVLTGASSAVEWAGAADLYVVVTGADDRKVWIVEPGEGVAITDQASMDATRMGKVSLDRARSAGPGTPVDRAGWREHTHLLRLLRAADLVGVSAQVQTMSVDHVQQREAFGRPIAMFQAVQHHLANVALEYEGSEALLHEALWRYSVGLPFERHAAMAAWHVGEATQRATQTANQLHGGMGFMKEYHLHHLFHRAIAQRSRMGTESERIGDLGDVVVEAAHRGYHQEFAEWTVLTEQATA